MWFLIVAENVLIIAYGWSEFIQVDWHVLHLTRCTLQLVGLEQVLVPKLVNQILRIVVHKVQMNWLKFEHVIINTAFTRFVNFWRSFHTCKFYILLNACLSYWLHIEDKFYKLTQGLLWA